MAVVAGVVIEFALIRRFRNSPRLVVTVATLGITQLLVVIGILIPRWWGRNLASERIAPPVGWKLTVGQVILNANHLIALVVAPLMMAGVAWFLARSRYGVAIRASAERGDRAAMLGIPVGRLNTLVWAIAAAMSFVALFLRSGIIGVPLGYAVGLAALLQALAALVIGGFERLPTVAAAAIALGLLESGVRFNSDYAGGGVSDHGRSHLRGVAGAANERRTARQRCRQHVARRRGGATVWRLPIVGIRRCESCGGR